METKQLRNLPTLILRTKRLFSTRYSQEMKDFFKRLHWIQWKAQDKYLHMSSLRNRILAAPEFSAPLIKTRQKPECTAGLKGRVAKERKKRLENLKKRLQWTRMHNQWTLEDWNQVFWTDESRCEVFGSKWTTLSTEIMKTGCLTPSLKHGGGNLMIRGCFGRVMCKASLISTKYHSILKRDAGLTSSISTTEPRKAGPKSSVTLPNQHSSRPGSKSAFSLNI